MASTALCITKIKECFERDGYYDLQDPVAEKRFKNLKDKGRRFITLYSFDFLKVIVLNLVKLSMQYLKSVFLSFF